MLNMRCRVCQNEFVPNKYRPNQQVCSRIACQRIRQIDNEREWRNKNPDYFKYLDQESSWRLNRLRYNRLWKSAHTDYLQEYERSHKEQRREYMREYMHRYREAKRNVNR